ncbi:Intercellular signal essential for a variety of patterning events during development (By similarity) [Seminavis robusta]|uniref:Intercellular signal essential for a variety of patterning events during development By similarity n=1 Tax=Seminavis robusta TaxID=568900 RepID=A0A9N8DND5_9STRA|nr:Intercellular signal essential for a variety of patterning events during development (By similarity) [Seminavis robusta]|eukprot:Sro179_g078330.1 Intercellular signal essential for a variety of patterning events during development (By similarity) (672) ;mRNA; r:4627-7149
MDISSHHQHQGVTVCAIPVASATPIASQTTSTDTVDSPLVSVQLVPDSREDEAESGEEKQEEDVELAQEHQRSPSRGRKFNTARREKEERLVATRAVTFGAVAKHGLRRSRPDPLIDTPETNLNRNESQTKTSTAIGRGAAGDIVGNNNGNSSEEIVSPLSVPDSAAEGVWTPTMIHLKTDMVNDSPLSPSTMESVHMPPHSIEPHPPARDGRNRTTSDSGYSIVVTIAVAGDNGANPPTTDTEINPTGAPSAIWLTPTPTNGGANSVTPDEVEDLICQTNLFIQNRVRNHTGDNTVTTEAFNIDWEFLLVDGSNGQAAPQPVAVSFLSKNTFGDMGAQVPGQLVSDAMQLQREDILVYIESYVWKGIPEGNMFRNITSASFDENIVGQPVHAGKLPTSSCQLNHWSPMYPTNSPTRAASTKRPTLTPSKGTTSDPPSPSPTLLPATAFPTKQPTIRLATMQPSPSSSLAEQQTTGHPTTLSPTVATELPSVNPTTAIPKTSTPTGPPTKGQTLPPTEQPITATPTTASPTTARPTGTGNPSAAPTTSYPTIQPTPQPTSKQPSSNPTAQPTTESPTYQPTSKQPSPNPTTQPTTNSPTYQPTSLPTSKPPTPTPTSQPIIQPATVDLFGTIYNVASTTEIRLANQGLTGSIPSGIGLLTALTATSLLEAC